MLTSYCSQALTAKTRNFINGHAPYLTFDGGHTRATNTDELLGITLSDGTIITRATNNSSASDPIELPNAGESFADIGMFVPTNIPNSSSGGNLVDANRLINPPYNYAGDDDGDDVLSLSTGDNSSTFFLRLKIYDRNNDRVERSEVLDSCNSPYRIELSASSYRSRSGILTTRNGVPNRAVYNGGSATYYIKPKGEGEPRVCFAKPNMTYSKGLYAGPSSEWDVYNGFIPQSTNSSSYYRNFPTTGANNLYFNLLIKNSGPLEWGDPITQGGITVTMTPDVTGEKVLVTLTGPAAKPEQLVANPSKQVDKPTLPQTFELVGRDNSGQAVVKYGFELKQWFFNGGKSEFHFSTLRQICNGNGYRYPIFADLTNAVDGSYIGATPSSPDNHYQRRIGAGLFTEWGVMASYAGANFVYAYSDENGGYGADSSSRNTNTKVSPNNGAIRGLPNYYTVYLVCAYP